MPAPPVLFDSPFPLLPDSAGARFYANVDNRLEVATARDAWTIPVAVPTELFTFMREVAKVPPEETVTLGLDETEDGEHYVFSMLAGDNLYDLWHWSRRSIPGWLLSRDHRL